MPTEIVDRGRGPQLSNSRITVYDILDYTTKNHDVKTIAVWLNLSSEQVLAAIRYIEEHKAEVMADYQEILERSARGNPPELQARLDADHAKFMEMIRQRKLANDQEKGDGNCPSPQFLARQP